LASWEIATFTGKLAPVDPELRKLLDEEVGPLARQLTYVYVLKASNSDLWNALCTRGRHWLWRFAWWLFVGSFITKRLKKVILLELIVVDKFIYALIVSCHIIYRE
jgi:hypothetical protein